MRIDRRSLGRYSRRRSSFEPDPFDDQSNLDPQVSQADDQAQAAADPSLSADSSGTPSAADATDSGTSGQSKARTSKPKFSTDFGIIQRLLEPIKGSFGQPVEPDHYMSFSELFNVFGSRPSFMVKEDKGDEKRFLVRAGFGRLPHTFVVKKEDDGSYGLYYQLKNRQERLGDLRVDQDGHIRVSKLAQERLNFHLDRQARGIKRNVMSAGIGLTALAGLGGIGYTILAGGRQPPPPPPPRPPQSEDNLKGNQDSELGLAPGPAPMGRPQGKDLIKSQRREDSRRRSGQEEIQRRSSGSGYHPDPYRILISFDPKRVEVVEKDRGRIEAVADTPQGQLQFRLDPKRSQVLVDGKVVGEFDTFTLFDALQRIQEGESLKKIERKDPFGELIRNPWFIIAVLTALIAFSRKR